MYHNLIERYRYGGDREIFKAQIFLILGSKYYTGYPGEALGYLDKWKGAVIRLENLESKETYSSETKRSMFSNNFTVINDIAHLVKKVRDSTKTWDKMSHSLQTKLAGRSGNSSRSASRGAIINSTNISDLEVVEVF